MSYGGRLQITFRIFFLQKSFVFRRDTVAPRGRPEDGRRHNTRVDYRYIQHTGGGGVAGMAHRSVHPASHQNQEINYLRITMMQNFKISLVVCVEGFWVEWFPSLCHAVRNVKWLGVVNFWSDT